jgi:ribokinase
MDMAGSRVGPIVCVGAHISALFVDVERIPAEGETILGSAIREPLDGGKSTCQAVAAARLGAPVTFVSVVGTDDRGRWWRSFLEGEGIDTNWLVSVEGSTDVGVVMLPPSRVPAIVSVMALSRHLDAPLVEAAADAIRTASMLICSLECPPDAVRTAFEIARAAGVTTVLNPAPVSGIGPELLSLADIIVPNEHEAAALAGTPGAPGDLSRVLAERHAPALVVVTAGEAGAYLARPGRALFRAPAASVEPVDTTGAGDAFIGAFAACLHRGAEPEEAVRYGVAVASQSVLREGSIASYPRLAELTA